MSVIFPNINRAGKPFGAKIVQDSSTNFYKLLNAVDLDWSDAELTFYTPSIEGTYKKEIGDNDNIIYTENTDINFTGVLYAKKTFKLNETEDLLDLLLNLYAREVWVTPEEYQLLKDNNEIDPNVEYNIYEEVDTTTQENNDIL